MKHVCKTGRIWPLVLALCFSFGLLAPMTAAAAADASVSGRSDFVWGVNGHNRGYAAYPEKELEKQLHLAAELGVKMYRFNFNPSTMSDLNYLDKVVKLAEAYGMELMLVMDGTDGSSEVLKSRFQMVASRYDGRSDHGRIRYIQVFNEVDVALMRETHPNGGEGDGSTERDYRKSSLDAYQKKFQAAIDGIKAGCSDTKAVINFSYRHTYMLEYFKDHGLKWDLIGLDWYSNMGDISGILDVLLSKFSHDIILCETNYWPEANNGYDANVSYLPNLMKQVYRYNNRIKGLIIYELLDEMRYEKDKGSFEGESHFGLVHCDENGNIGAVKPAYTAVQKLLDGRSLPMKTIAAGAPDTTAPPAATSRPAATTRSAVTAATKVPARPAAVPDSGTTKETPAGGTEETPSASSADSIPAGSTSAGSTSADSTAAGPASTGSTSAASLSAGTVTPEKNTPVWPFIVIPAAVLVIGAGVFLLLKFKFGMFGGASRS